MPWRVTSVETLRVQFCQRVVEEGESVSSACRSFGVSRKTGYKWLQRYQEHGRSGLSNRSRRPRYRPGRASAALEALVIEFKHRYPYWGPRKLHHLVYASHPDTEQVAVSTFARILERHGLVTPREEPVEQTAVGRFERAKPNELWQMDLKMAMRSPNGTRRYVAGILDDHSRFALNLRWLPDISDQSVLACWIDTAQNYGLPEATLTDHGAQFCMQDNCSSTFRSYLWACGVKHSQGRIGHPQTQGKIERFWGTFQRELTPQLCAVNPIHWHELMEGWRIQYNTVRPHESLGDAPPATRYETSQRPFVQPDRHAKIGKDDSIYRRVSPKGQISLGGHRVMIGRGLANWTVEVRPLGNGCWHVYFRHHFLREFMLNEQPKV